MSLTADQGLIIPNSSDNDNVPLSVSDYNTGVESRLVKRYASVADRTARNATPTEGELSYLLDLNRFDFYSGAAWTTLQSSLVAQPITVTVKTATESVVSSTTMQNDNDFFFSAAASSTYKVELDLFISGPNGSSVGEILCQWTVPTSTTSDFGIMSQDWGLASGAIGSVNLQAGHSTGTTTATVLLGTSVFQCYARVSAVFRVGGTAGTIQFQWAQNTSNATASNILEGSSMTIIKVS